MEKLEFNESLESNISVLDAQHRNIAKLLNKIFSYFNDNQLDNEVFREAIDELDNYMSLHFQLEEYYASRYSFPDYEKLIAEHENLKKTYSLFRYYIFVPVNSKEVSEKIINSLGIVLADLLRNHLLTIDKELSLFLKGKDIKVI